MSAPTYNPNPNAQVPNPDLINSTRQDISAGLIEASFGILGQTFAQDANNPALAEPYAKLGATISNALHDRWHKQEYENFQAQYVNQYQSAANAISGNLQMQMSSLDRGEMIQPDGSITKIDPKSEGFLRTKDTVIRQSMQAIHRINDQFLQDAAKFTTNPYISQVAQNLMQGTANLVSEATGPTPADETEKGYADIENTREQSAYYRRLPQPHAGSGSDDINKRGDPRALLEELGVPGFMEYLVGTEQGRKWTEPYQIQEAGRVRDEILEKNPELADDPDALAEMLKAREGEIQERAAGSYMGITFPGESEVMKDPYYKKQFGRFFHERKETEEPAQVATALTSKEEAEKLDEVYDQAVVVLDEVIRTGSPRSINEAINQVLNKWFPGFIKKYAAGSPGAIAFRKKAKSKLIEFLSKQENWERSEIAKEKFGRKEFGAYEKWRGGLFGEGAPESKATSPEKGLFK